MTFQHYARPALRALVACLALSTAAAAFAGPVFDPFLERFQVGVYADPDKIPTAAGYPMGLLEPIRVDEAWIDAALAVVKSGEPSAESAELSLRLMASFEPAAEGAERLRGLERKIRYLRGGWSADVARMEAGYLDTPILGLEVFRRLGSGRVAEAAALAVLLADRPVEGAWTERDAFVWEMRARLLERMAGDEGENFDGELWTSMLDLAPYDRGNAWALWVMHRRHSEKELLPAAMASGRGERFLSGLRRAWLSPDELYASYFEHEAQAALGAAIFSGDDLRAHLGRFAQPPVGIERQGLWVRGARFDRRGQATAYEEIARRADLLPGWRMDLLRRASEIHFLAGRDADGRRDLQQALTIAEKREGTLPLRRRLRQWSEQALVLALARRDTVLAESIYTQARASFFQEEAEAFASETDYWLPMLHAGTDGAKTGEDPKSRAKRLVESGGSAALAPAPETAREAFVAASARPLWRLWAEWGIGLAEAGNLTGAKREKAAAYEAQLRGALKTDDGDGGAIEAAALRCVALRWKVPANRDRILETALGGDIARRSDWKGTYAASVVPGLLPAARTSQLDMHALLGFCLAAGDLRGVLGLATELPARGISSQDKLRFLYPLPQEGPIRDAITAQDSEPALILAIARNESLFDPTVRSRAGALGFMQIMPFHYDGRGALPGERNWACPDVSIEKGARILAGDRRRYDGDPYLTVASYNAGPQAASRWLEQLGGVPDRDIYLAWIGYPETRRYVEKVLIDREIYDWIIRTESGDNPDGTPSE